MNTNQLKMQDALSKTHTALDTYTKALQAYREEAKRIETTPYIDEEKKRLTREALEKLEGSVAAVRDDILVNIEAIRKAAMELESVFDLSPELQAAIRLVSAAGDKLKPETRANLIKSFVGNKQALVMLRSLFEAKALDTDSVRHYIIDADKWCADLEEAAHAMADQPEMNIARAAAMAKKLDDFAERQGITLATKAFDSLDTAEYYSNLMRASMGLPNQ